MTIDLHDSGDGYEFLLWPGDRRPRIAVIRSHGTANGRMCRIPGDMRLFFPVPHGDRLMGVVPRTSQVSMGTRAAMLDMVEFETLVEGQCPDYTLTRTQVGNFPETTGGIRRLMEECVESQVEPKDFVMIGAGQITLQQALNSLYRYRNQDGSRAFEIVVCLFCRRAEGIAPTQRDVYGRHFMGEGAFDYAPAGRPSSPMGPSTSTRRVTFRERIEVRRYRDRRGNLIEETVKQRTWY